MSERNNFLLKFTDLANGNIAQYYVSTLSNVRIAITYENLNELSNKISDFLRELCKGYQGYVAVQLTDDLWLPSIVLSIWKSNFAFVGFSRNTQTIKKFQSAFVVTDSVLTLDEYVLEQQFYINEDVFYFYKCQALCNRKEPWDMCFGITTSGSTGDSKIVQVPWNSIMGNVKELGNKFQLKSQDKIFLSSPYTFDPMFVELLLTFYNGAALVLVSNSLKLSRKLLLDVLFGSETVDGNGVDLITKEVKDGSKKFICHFDVLNKVPNITLLQITPSLFQLWDKEEIKQLVLSPKSSLSVLVLGGESFPMEILSLKHPSNTTKIFNIYGITEVSCWAFIHEVKCGYEDEIPLGVALQDIQYELVNHEEYHELVLHSHTRRCLVGEEAEFTTQNLTRETGDLVVVKNNNIYYHSRKNQIVKKYGIKVDLRKIEQHFNNICQVSCFCVYYEKLQKLILVWVDTNKKDANYVLTNENAQFKACNAQLEGVEQIDSFVSTVWSNLPLNENGKVDRIRLLKYIKLCLAKHKVEQVTFRDVWCDVLNTGNACESFQALGGTSVQALRIMGQLEDLGYSVDPSLIGVMMKEGTYEACSALVREPSKRKKTEVLDSDSTLEIKWSYSFQKCVDASPRLINIKNTTAVVVGSHSLQLVALEVYSGRVLWTVQLGDRIESAVCLSQDRLSLFIGCYDHNLYCLRSEDGCCLWQYTTGEMVKSTPCLSTDGTRVFAASYDGFLYSIQAKEGSMLASLKLTNGGIYSSPISDDKSGALYIAALDGTCSCVDQESFKIKWRHKLASPVFSTPCLLQDSRVLFGEVAGGVHCFTDSGVKVWSYQCQGNLYSSFALTQQLVYFGCHDECLYAVTHSGDLVSRTKLDAAVFATPCTSESDVLVCTTRGNVLLFDTKLSRIGCRQLPGECFSSPLIFRQQILVGCRDNHLYCLGIPTKP